MPADFDAIDALLFLTTDGKLIKVPPPAPAAAAPPAGAALPLPDTFYACTAAPLSRSRSRSRSQSPVRSATPGIGASSSFDDSVLSTWSATRQLYRENAEPADPLAGFRFEALPIPWPPGPDATRIEIDELLRKQTALVGDTERQKEIQAQSTTATLSDILRPIGIDGLSGYDNTLRLIELLLQIAERVGYFYKELFSRLRPNVVDARLRPFLAIPPHASYPSNHSFQMFSLAENLTRLVPEHPGVPELFFVAERVAENREYAGLHYSSDTHGGRILAKWFAPYMVSACRREMRLALTEWL